MKLVYKGKMGGLAIGPHSLPRGEEVEVEDEKMAEMMLGIKGVELVKSEGGKKTTSKSKSATIEGNANDKDDA